MSGGLVDLQTVSGLMLQFAGSGGAMQQQANGTGGSKHGDAAALIALAGAAGLPDGPAGYPFKPEGSNGSDQTGLCHACALQLCLSVQVLR